MSDLATLGRYRLVRKLAVGGMAEIFLAQMTGAGGFAKNVVIKRIQPHLAHDGELYRMFVDEARIAAALQHPHIVQVYDCGEQGGEFFIAMEYLDGADLQTLRGTLARKKKGLPLIHTIHVASAIAAGLHYAHERTDADGRPLGIVHRDVTPANVFVTRDGGIKLLDFGIAKAADRMTQTSHGTLKGKVAYMSPEQVAGDAIDRRSDVYALGVLLYEMTTGRRLHGGKTEYQALKDIVEGEVPPPTSIHPRYPAALERVILRALARDRRDRHQTARELGRDLDGFAREQRLMVSSIGLAEYLAPLLPEAQAYAEERLTRARDRALRLTGPQPLAGDGDVPAAPAAAGPRAISEGGAPLARALAPRGASEVGLDTLRDDPGAGALARAAAGGAAAPTGVEPPYRVTSDPDDPMAAVSEVHVDLVDEANRLLGRRRPRWRRYLASGAIGGALVAAALTAVRARESAGPTAPAGAAAPAIGRVAIRSEPRGAEVWLSLGRTPVDSPPLDPRGSYRVRVEHEGYLPIERAVTPADFRPGPTGPTAQVEAELEPAPAGGAAPAGGRPADPTIAPADPTIDLGADDGGAGRGRLRIAASRTAAAAWLYLGTAPLDLRLLNDRRYELKVAAAGSAPYFRVVEPRDFELAAGQPVEIAAALRRLPEPPPPPEPPARPKQRRRIR